MKTNPLEVLVQSVVDEGRPLDTLTAAKILTLAQSGALREPPAPTEGLEPRGCPTPGACSCPVSRGAPSAPTTTNSPPVSSSLGVGVPALDAAPKLWPLSKLGDGLHIIAESSPWDEVFTAEEIQEAKRLIEKLGEFQGSAPPEPAPSGPYGVVSNGSVEHWVTDSPAFAQYGPFTEQQALAVRDALNRLSGDAHD